MKKHIQLKCINTFFFGGGGGGGGCSYYLYDIYCKYEFSFILLLYLKVVLNTTIHLDIFINIRSDENRIVSEYIKTEESAT